MAWVGKIRVGPAIRRCPFPDALLACVQTYIHSRHVFLFALNVLLLILGSLLEIYSALIIIVPC